ncbi:PREDICTED: F-box only protein 7-like [Eufriesea mexicana]|uniref:F-box only protein 7-like n=1 Tax=Eufriesea mexicana TaxID=516756 RepID=UPI00083C442F|nr:PREDICTED: F-box only protein 7-like [Eufriesea mexicana]
MWEPILVEDSTYLNLVPSLRGILKSLNEKSTHQDYMVALMIVLLAEAGFYLSSINSNSSRRPDLKSLQIPKDWKSQETGVYEMYFHLETVPDIKCKLLVTTLGNTLICNFFSLMDGRKTYNLSVPTLKYVNPFASDICARYLNLKLISHRFKDTLSTPVRSDVLIKAGVMGPSLQALPTELKLKILRLLDAYSLTRMAQCCSEFRELCSESQLWKDLLHRDFPKYSVTAAMPKDYYRFRYNNRKRNQRRLQESRIRTTMF